MDELRTQVMAAQHGDAEAFGEIVARFRAMAVATGYAMLGDVHLAQDAAQDAFIEAYFSLNALREPAAFPGWFRRIVYKNADRQLRKHNREWPLDAFDNAADAFSLADSVEAMFVQQRVRDALSGLPERQHLLASLFYLDGYSQQEIVDFLNLPLSSVKKGLFLARKRLRKEMQDMADSTPIKTDKSDKTDAMTEKVQFFAALRQHDVPRMKQLLAQKLDWFEAPTEWGVLPNSSYWPLGYTALHWANATNDEPMLDALLEIALTQGADVNVRTQNWRATALHIAAMMRRPTMTQRLLNAGANPGETDEGGHTPLHLAAYFGDVDSAVALLAAGAPVHIKDKGGRTALDWAVLKRHAGIADALRAKGATSKMQAHEPVAPNRATPILETGIKIVDFCAPLKRGAANAIFSPKSGVGKVVQIENLMHIMAAHYGGHSIFLGVEQGEDTLRDMALQFHEAGLSEAVTLIFAQAGDAGSYVRAVGASVAAANARQGEVLVFVDAAFAEQGAQAQLENAIGENMTLIWYGDYTAGAEPDNFASLNGLITFELWRAYQGLWPTIDPLNSRSTLVLDERHARLLRQVRRLLRRFEDLRPMVEKDPRGIGALATDDDRRDVERARKLHAFFSQPFAVAEMYTNLLGEYVPLSDTLDGVEAILAGEADEVAEEKLRFIGGMDRYFRR